MSDPGNVRLKKPNPSLHEIKSSEVRHISQYLIKMPLSKSYKKIVQSSYWRYRIVREHLLEEVMSKPSLKVLVIVTKGRKFAKDWEKGGISVLGKVQKSILEA